MADNITRFGGDVRCPICSGAADDPRGAGKRCVGYLASDPRFAYCTREEHASGLAVEATDPPSFRHFLGGACRCGKTHQPGLTTHSEPRSQPRSPKPLGTLVTQYVYCDSDGSPLMKVMRFDPKDFRQAQVVGRSADGLPQWDFKSMKGAKYVPYRLPELERSRGEDAIVFIGEGEKDVDRLLSLGIIATTVPAHRYTQFQPLAANLRLMQRSEKFIRQGSMR